MKKCKKCLGEGLYYVSCFREKRQKDGSTNTSDWGYYMPCDCQKKLVEVIHKPPHCIDEK